MTCAQCAIWVATTLMSPQLGHRHALPYEITSAALREAGWHGRPLPSTGLVIEQMLNALVKLGYNPIYHAKSENVEIPWDPAKLIYPYIESGIPVIAIVPHHAFTVVGHLSGWNATIDSDHKCWLENSEPSTPGYPSVTCLSSHTWSSGFLIQDDNVGPYSVLPIDKPRKVDLAETYWGRLMAGTRYEPYGSPLYSTADEIDYILIPLPQKVYLRAENCLTNTLGLLRTIAGGGFEFYEGGLNAWCSRHPLLAQLLEGLNQRLLILPWLDYISPVLVNTKQACCVGTYRNAYLTG